MEIRKASFQIAALAVSAGILTAGTIAMAPSATAAGTVQVSMSKFDDRMIADINRVRAAHGLKQLVTAAGTTDVAHGWTCHLAAEQALSHNPALLRELRTHGSTYLTQYDENVGSASSADGADWLFNAYMRSPEHRANILDPAARYIGSWTKTNGHFRYNTIDFVGSRWSAYSSSYGITRTTC